MDYPVQLIIEFRMKVKNSARFDKDKELFFIRRNRSPLKRGYDSIDEALKKFNDIIESPVYRSGEHPGDLWELVAKDPYSNIVLKSEIKELKCL